MRGDGGGVSEAGARLGVQVDAELVGGDSTSSRHTGHGWKVRVPRLADQAITDSSVGQTSSAVRPLGKAIRAVCTYGGAPGGTRFWKKASPELSARVDSRAPSNTPVRHRSRVVGRSCRAARIPSPTAR